MATFDAADPRWLVKDMGDAGTNVNNWHWREYDAMEWSKAQLSQAFAGKVLVEDDNVKIECSEVSCTGEAAINNRKNKLIPAYELSIKLSWKGSIKATSTVRTGTVVLPYVADENHDEDPEIKFSCSGEEDEEAGKLKSAFLSGASGGAGKLMVLEGIQAFVQELKQGGPLKPGTKGLAAALADAEAAEKLANTTLGGAGGVEKVEQQPRVKLGEVARPAEKMTAPAGKEEGKSLNMTEKYYARPNDIFTCFVIEGKVKAFTQSNAVVEPRVGGRVQWFSGSVEGEFLELVPDTKVVMKWRFSNWEDGVWSKVTLTLEEAEPGTTICKLEQTGIPYEDRFGQAVQEHTENGWRNQIFGRIRQVFGYGV